MESYKIITLIFLINIISFTSAFNFDSNLLKTEDLGIFKQRECVSLYQLCDLCSYVNITSITFPNSTTLYLNEEMNKEGNIYTYEFCDTEIIGQYFYSSCGDKDTLSCEVIKFEITPTGLINSIGYYILILIFSLGVIILGLWKKDAPITILGSFGLYFLGIYILFFGIVGVKDPIYTWTTSIIILALAFYISVRSSYELITD